MEAEVVRHAAPAAALVGDIFKLSLSGLLIQAK
jgi:hypothetical protein